LAIDENINLREPCKYYKGEFTVNALVHATQTQSSSGTNLQEVHDVVLNVLAAKHAHVERGGLEAVPLGRVAHEAAKQQEHADVVAHRLGRHLAGVAVPVPDLLAVLGEALALLLQQRRHFFGPQAVLVQHRVLVGQRLPERKVVDQAAQRGLGVRLQR
jgi:hypothetical protein